MDDARHSFVEHTSEVELRLDAPTLAALFVEAGRALAELMLVEVTGPEMVRERVTVAAPDRAALLAAWIDEREIDAEIGGIADPVIKTAVKAATFHDLRVAEENGRWVATVVLDV